MSGIIRLSCWVCLEGTPAVSSTTGPLSELPAGTHMRSPVSAGCHLFLLSFLFIFSSFVFDHITLHSNSNISKKASKNSSLFYRQQCFLSQLKRRTSRSNPGSQGFYYCCYARQNERVQSGAGTELCVHSSFHLFG